MAKSKMSRSIEIMHKAKHLLERRSGIILHFPCFFHTSPIVVNCGGHIQFKHKNVYILHKKTVRIACNVDYLELPSNVLFIELHVLK